MARKHIKLTRKYLLAALAALLVVILVIYFVFFHSNKLVIPSTNPLGNSSGNARPPGSSSSSTANQSPPPASKTQSNTPASSTTLITPYGNFVSNHHPGGSVPTAEESVCNTTTGASCYIKFTKGTEVKQLTAQTANSNGAALWDWDVASAGLDSGSWTVTAVATLSSQTKTATDAQSLVVQ